MAENKWPKGVIITHVAVEAIIMRLLTVLRPARADQCASTPR
jgi:hypothetical protein